MINLIKKITNPIFFSFGIFLCVFNIFFLITGMDEIWNGDRVWLYGLGIAGLLGSIGVSAIIISSNDKKRAPLIFLVSSIIFLILTIVGFISS